MGKRNTKGTRTPAELVPLHRRAAGIDVGSTFHVVAVPTDLDAEPVRTFKSFTGDLQRLAEWLVSLGVTAIENGPGSAHENGPGVTRSLLG